MKISGNIIERIYRLGLTNQLIEIWETDHYRPNTVPEDFLHVKNILVPDFTYWDSCNIVRPPSFVIHFKHHIIHSKEYQLTSNNYTDAYPNSWKVFGSMDNKTWFELNDIVDNHNFKDQSRVTLPFSMKESAFSWIKFIFTKTQKDECTVYLQQFDIHGIAFPITPATCKHNSLIRLTLFTTILFLSK